VWLRTSKLPLSDREGKVTGVIELRRHHRPQSRGRSGPILSLLRRSYGLPNRPSFRIAWPRHSPVLVGGRTGLRFCSSTSTGSKTSTTHSDTRSATFSYKKLQSGLRNGHGNRTRWLGRGDEFVIVLTAAKDGADAAVAAERLVHAMSAAIVVQGRTLSVGCSLGISIFPEHGADSET